MTEPIVTITNGQLKGKISENYLGGKFYSFLGIPYAKPPVGELRFKAPVPVDSWSGIRDATKEGPECPSRHMIFMHKVGSADNCLNLNVYSKEIKKNDVKPKPVMVWFHGGGFMYGSNKSEFFGPEYLLTEDIVLVTTNYRLGALGFLSFEDPSLGVPGNAAMKDMILALQWVQKNIESFNGDPGNVTIFGESAGGASVHYLYLSPLSKGLFHKVIAQSGCSLNCWAKGQSNGKLLAKDLGIEETDEKKILEQLQEMPVEKVVEASYKKFEPLSAGIHRRFGPVVEKPSNEPAFLTEEPIEILKNGRFNHVPLIMGYTSKEGIFHDLFRKVFPNDFDKVDFEAEIPYELHFERGSEKSKEIASKIENFYFGENGSLESKKDGIRVLKTDNIFFHGIYRSIQLQKQKSNAPIYMYRLSLDTSLNFYKIMSQAKFLRILFTLYFLANKLKEGVRKTLVLKLSRLIPKTPISGACHADDLFYIFKGFLNDKLERGSVEETSVKRFVRLWTNFARTGNPTPEVDELLNNVEWKPVTAEDNYFLEIDKELNIGKNPDSERMQFWESIYST